jgi:hypothetical protein
MAEQSLLIRIGIDPSGAVTGGKVVEGSLGGVDNRLKGMNQRFGEGASYGDRLTHSLGRLGSAGRMDAFRMLSSDILVATTNMGGMGKASGLLRVGFFSVQSALGAFLGPMGLAGVAIAGSAVIQIFSRLGTEQKALGEEINKSKEPLKYLIENFTQWADLAQRLLIYSLKQTELELIRNEAAIRKLQEEGAKPNFWDRLTKIVGLFYAYKEINVPAMVDAEVNSEERLNSELLKLLRNEGDLLKMKGALGEAIEPPNVKAWIEANNLIKENINLWIMFGAMSQGKRREPIIPDVKPITKELVALDKELRQKPEDIGKMINKIEELRNMSVTYISQISTAFADSMLGIEVRWGDMIKNMITQFVASGIEDLIKKAFGYKSGFGILGTALGWVTALQSGTPYVPQTGLYILHRGEAVVPANQNVYRSSVFNQDHSGDTFNVQILQLDIKKLTKDKIIPIIKEAVKNRELTL